MGYSRHAFIIFCLAVAAWAAEPRATMVLEIKGQTTAFIDGRARQVRTLQVLPSGTKISVGKESKLRLTYFKSGLKETVQGPLAFTTGQDKSSEVSGDGKMVAETSAGSQTLVPKSDNLRRMGGTVHAMLDLDALALLERLPADPPIARPSINRIPAAPPTRKPGKLVLEGLSPVLRGQGNQDVSWAGGRAPFQVSLSRKGMDSPIISATTNVSSYSLSELKPGKAYLLRVKDSVGATVEKELYLLSASEERAIDEDLSALSSDAGQDGRLARIVYLEQSGLLAEARELAQQASLSAPNDIGLLTAVGRLQLRLGLYEQAETTLNQAIELDSQRKSP